MIIIKMSSHGLKKKLLKLVDRHNALLDRMLHTPPMLRGSFTKVSTRCGKPNCWCAKSSQGHTHTRLTWSEKGKMSTRKVPAEQVERIKELTANYRKFRRHRRELLELHRQLQETLTRFEATVTEQTRNPLSFLALTPKIASKSDTKQRKPQRNI